MVVAVAEAEAEVEADPMVAAQEAEDLEDLVEEAVVAEAEAEVEVEAEVVGPRVSIPATLAGTTLMKNGLSSTMSNVHKQDLQERGEIM